MPNCYYCNGSARCAVCTGTGIQTDGRVCNVCGGRGRCTHCTNGQMRVSARGLAGLPFRRRLGLAGGALALATSGAASAQTVGVGLTVLQDPAGANGTARAFAVSADGRIAVGDALDTTTGQTVIWRDGIPARVTGQLPNGAPIQGGYYAIWLTPDGATMAGNYSPYSSTPLSGYVAYGSTAGGLRLLPDISATEFATNAGGISADGSMVAVNATFKQRGSLYDGTLNPVLVPPFPGGSSTPPPPAGTLGNVYRWSAATGYQAIGHVSTNPEEQLLATGMSGDGRIIVGKAINADPGVVSQPAVAETGSSAFIWREGGPPTLLPYLSAAPKGDATLRSAAATMISRDGSTVVGGSIGSDGVFSAVYWRNGAVVSLGYTPGAFSLSQAYAVNGDGSVIIGEDDGLGGADGSFRDFRWTATTGRQSIKQILLDAGIAVDTVNIRAVDGGNPLSDDGRSILAYYVRTASSAQQEVIIQLAQVTRAQLIVRVVGPGVTLQSTVNQTFNTQVQGTLNGQVLFDRTVTDTIDSPLGAQALTDARAALRVSGLRRLVIGAPTLVSTTTKVLGMTSTTVDVVTGTTVTTATVNTNGPATVATGDLGTCATAAASGVNPTGCSQAGTPVAVPAGVINSNVFTNTINAVTPTTSQTVDQLVTSRWQVAATAGNQFGTVHALVGPAAFERGDRLMRQLLDGAGALERRALGTGGLAMFGGYFGSWSRTAADPSIPVAGARGRTDGMTFGLEKQVGGGSRFGLAFDWGETTIEVRDPAFPEALTFSLAQIGLFGAVPAGRLTLSAGAAYGFGRAKTSIATPDGAANASRRTSSFAIAGQADFRLVEARNVSFDVVAGVRHSAARLSRFTEVGGTSPLTGLDRTVSRTRVFAGAEVGGTVHLGGLVVLPYANVHYAHDSGAPAGIAAVAFADTPGAPALSAFGPGVGRDVAEVGAGLAVRLSGRASLGVSYDANCRRSANSRSAKAVFNLRL